MFGIGPGELLLIFLIALFVLGPERLPSTARDLGKAMNELRKVSDELTREFLNADQARPASTPAVPPVAPSRPSRSSRTSRRRRSKRAREGPRRPRPTAPCRSPRATALRPSVPRASVPRQSASPTPSFRILREF